ncbi:MAG TPA: LytTR family DNA-binding domain-containing protein [Candidatus Saccharimonadales bacterium]|nr:LytTR family DNA-binding domain-containing protein [Candidatus Saccharimonadales bacterium]
MKIRAMIADDEPLARERLRDLLSADSRIDLIAECTDGRQAVETIQTQSPDLVFLDVQMPELDGFGVLAELDPKQRPAIIFVTAHDKFALRAFEVHALDYLLKPFDRDRFKAALDRALTHLQQHDTKDLKDRLSALLKDVRPETKHAERIAIKSSGKVIFLKTSEIDWIEAADNYVNLHAGAESHLHRETMSSLEELLDPARFMRINRSTMVNLDCIKELQPLFHGEYSVILKNGTRLTLSRGYREKLQQLLGKFG